MLPGAAAAAVASDTLKSSEQGGGKKKEKVTMWLGLTSLRAKRLVRARRKASEALHKHFRSNRAAPYCRGKAAALFSERPETPFAKEKNPPSKFNIAKCKELPTIEQYFHFDA